MMELTKAGDEYTMQVTEFVRPHGIKMTRTFDITHAMYNHCQALKANGLTVSYEMLSGFDTENRTMTAWYISDDYHEVDICTMMVIWHRSNTSENIAAAERKIISQDISALLRARQAMVNALETEKFDDFDDVLEAVDDVDDGQYTTKEELRHMMNASGKTMTNEELKHLMVTTGNSLDDMIDENRSRDTEQRRAAFEAQHMMTLAQLQQLADEHGWENDEALAKGNKLKDEWVDDHVDIDAGMSNWIGIGDVIKKVLTPEMLREHLESERDKNGETPL